MMIIGAIFFAFVAACALVLLLAIVKSAIDDTRAPAAARTPVPSAVVILPGEREARYTRQPARTGRFDRDRQAEPVNR
jgi:hypothetical protein